MIQYLDTSVLVSALTKEVATTRVQTWLVDQDSANLAISDWVIAEFSAALSVKLRVGTIDANERSEALAEFREMSESALRVLTVGRAQFHAAASLAGQFALGLKAGDALHVAIAFDHGARLCTLDRRLSKAAHSLGASAMLISV